MFLQSWRLHEFSNSWLRIVSILLPNRVVTIEKSLTPWSLKWYDCSMQEQSNLRNTLGEFQYWWFTRRMVRNDQVLITLSPSIDILTLMFILHPYPWSYQQSDPKHLLLLLNRLEMGLPSGPSCFQKKGRWQRLR